MGRRRETIGELANVEDVVMIDDWKAAAEPHQLLSQPCTGIAFFTVPGHAENLRTGSTSDDV